MIKAKDLRRFYDANIACGDISEAAEARMLVKSAGQREPTPATRLLGAFVSNQRGVAAVEFAFVLPVLIVLLTGIVQMGLVFFVQNNMTSVAQETARLVSLNALTTDEGETYAEDHLLNWGMTYDISVQQQADDIVVDISVPRSDVAVIDFLGLFDTGNMTAQSSMRAL